MSVIWLYQRLSSVRLVKPLSGVMSVIWLYQRSSQVRLVKPLSGVMSVIWFSERSSLVKLVSPASGVMSVIWLPKRPSEVRLTAYSKPLKSVIPCFCATNLVSLAISSLVISPVGFLSFHRIAASKLASLNVTTYGGNLVTSGTVSPVYTITIWRSPHQATL